MKKFMTIAAVVKGLNDAILYQKDKYTAAFNYLSSLNKEDLINYIIITTFKKL